ncbi:SagB family peptide dehydrogenase [Krasilnikovia sp. MM14-A1259]|uniref:SagB family peptide dehydrogenase n=1 Tax=Krasilnikovia sp. MM14-A1259 TaxID=3373539 RepID=UPI0037F1B04A
MAEQLLSADAMYRAVHSDPQFACPRRPALVQGLVRLDLPDGILFEGGPSRQILRGAATKDLVPAVLPLLDGTLDADGIATRSGLPRPHVDRVIALLYTCGLLEEGEQAAAVGDPNAALFWSRSLDSSRANRSTSEVLRRLDTARVGVSGSGLLADLVLADLQANGIGAKAVSDSTPEPDYDLVVGVSDHANADLRHMADACAAHHVPFLPLRLSGRGVEVGPYLDPAFTASFADYDRQRRADPIKDDAGELSFPVRAKLAAALGSGQIVGLLARIGTVPVLRGLLRVDLVDWSHRIHVISPIPDSVGPQVRTTTAGVPLAVCYESSVAFTPRHLLNPKAHQVHYKPGNLALQHESKRWPSAPLLDLAPWASVPPGPLRRSSAAKNDGDIALPAIAAVLQRAAGLRPGPSFEQKVQRWAPTGGNLGSVQLHLLAHRVEGLTPGVWGYVGDQHALARLRDQDDLSALGHRSGEPAAAIVLTAALARVASKYLGFAWRVVHLDAGAAIAQLAYTARAFGLAAHPLPRWDDQCIADLLDLDLDSEPVTGVVLLGSASEGEQQR